MSEVLNEYRKVQEKFKLPHLEKLQQTFQFDLEEIYDIDQIRDEISERLFEFTERVIEPLIWSSNHTHIIEREMMSKAETEEIFALYKKIQALRWKNNLLTIRANKEETAKWIKELWDFWREFENKTIKLCGKFSYGWETLSFKEALAEYQG